MSQSRGGRLSSSQAASSGLFSKPWPFLALGMVLVIFSAWLWFSDSKKSQSGELALEQAGRLVTDLRVPVDELRGVLQDENVLNLAASVLEDSNNRPELLMSLTGKVEGLHDIRVYGPDVLLIGLDTLGEAGLVILDMFLTLSPAQQNISLAQMIQEGDRRWFASATVLGTPEEPLGYVLLLLQEDVVLGRFNTTLPAAGYIALQQRAGSHRPFVLKTYGADLPSGEAMNHLSIPGSMLMVTVPQAIAVDDSGNFQRLMIFLLGALLIAWGMVRRQQMLKSQAEFQPDPDGISSSFEPATFEPAKWSVLATEPGIDTPTTGPGTNPATPPPEEEPLTLPPPHSEEGEIALSDIHYQLESKQRSSGAKKEQVVLTSEIFRAYDIRGVVGKSIDAGVAFQVGQAVGSVAQQRSAAPVVVARDGRHSGPELVQGFLKGLNASGCDAIDIGAVPTGVLYYAAYELGSGSGVMITGSHNPPDYNGIKILVGGRTLAGKEIFNLYERIQSGDLLSGEGTTIRDDMLRRYRDRIAGDIKMARPLKVVADCGNGIGGVCAAEVLSGIGAEVMPLFDEVDGDFPNHHPDPSEPHNLNDLIEAVQLMNADLGVAFDGDADRLGVVTPRGEIIYPDRIMMLFIKEILGRKPGGNIIYDVKCTGKLDAIITEAGGQPEMYKTGHSLIKNRMKEVDSPFAAEMSGHFFFADRWYGFDCGIYTACRLLEILANDPRPPQQVFDALPNSISTPELKVHLEEGENHAFIARFTDEAEFENARINTIDGLRADFEDGWGLVRASNTTPVLVLRFDADNQEALVRIKEAFRAQLLAINEHLELPF
jgi:phosphomannomutase